MLVGCGAVTRASLLPVLAGHDAVSIHALVDRDERRARELADAYGIATVLTDADALSPRDVDGLVLATPPAHHAPATLAALEKGLHVFVEKPMALRAVDARAMVDAASRARRVLSVGLYRRFLPSVQLLRTLVASGDFGPVLSVDAEEGGPYGWGLATLDVLTREKGGGGTLIDLGSHVIDLVLYVLGATPSLVRCVDNSRGGIETDCVVDAALRIGARTAPFRLELSRTRELRGSIRIECEDAVLELPRASFTEVLVHRRSASGASRPYRLAASWDEQRDYVGYAAFRAEFDDWLGAIAGGGEPVLSGRSVLPVVELIEACYAHREDMPEPWTDVGFRAPAVRPAPARRRVLVTGAGGFLGNRTVELLRHRFGCDPVPLIREPKGAARLARWPGDIVLGDICSRADMDRAMRGVDAVVHCAVGTSWKPEETRRVTVDGTRIVAEAARAAGVSRFVHISTLFVHQRDQGGTIDEQTALNPPADDSYGQAKLAAEQALALVAKQGLSTIVLRPTRIYGPFSRTFTVRPMEAMLRDQFAISGSPDLPANMVFVDNVVEAIAAALEAPDARSGGAYIVTDPDQLSLGDFFGYFARAAGARIHLLPARQPASAGARAGWISGLKTIALAPEVRALVHRIMDTDPVGAMPKRLWEASPDVQRRLLKLFKVDAAVVYRPAPGGAAGEMLDYWSEPGRASCGRLEAELGWSAPLTRERAMAITLEWATAARLTRMEAPALLGAAHGV